jgi:hypothetical protein
MFRLHAPPIVVTQNEHARLAAALARRWGNDDFDRPALDFESFVHGVFVHDWHYGLVDELPLDDLGGPWGPAEEATWRTITARAAEIRFADPVADVVAKMHTRRLLEGDDDAESADIAARLDRAIAARLPETGCERAVFEWADRITRFCDIVAYDFFRRQHIDRPIPVCARVGSMAETPLEFTVGIGRRISVDPWPFSMPSFTGVLTAYERSVYPDELRPVPLRYVVEP